jgi:hypothetical protein
MARVEKKKKEKEKGKEKETVAASRRGHGKKCPKCKEFGSPQLKEIKNRKGGNAYKYLYFAHSTGPHSVRWCYVGGKKKDTGDGVSARNARNDRNDRAKRKPGHSGGPAK